MCFNQKLTIRQSLREFISDLVVTHITIEYAMYAICTTHTKFTQVDQIQFISHFFQLLIYFVNKFYAVFLSIVVVENVFIKSYFVENQFQLFFE